MTVSDTTAAPPRFGAALRRLYFIRVVFAFAWAALVFTVAGSSGPLLTALLVVYPLFDAGAVLWQLRSKDRVPGSPQAAEWINVAVSVTVAIALGWASTVSPATALIVWGVWAIGSGIPQLVAALRRWRTGGQLPQVLSGGLSVLAGSAFLLQGLQGSGDIAGVGGYAAVGGVFFLVSAIRLTVLLRKKAS
ncbi:MULTISPECIES: hypothetical protein [unclassified Nocardiopsis]|uniref:hypothetical protein n=1 Tax=Nocardiopsis TaxID=2013 RepID=UPI00387AFA54